MTSLSAALSLVLSNEMFSLHRSVNVITAKCPRFQSACLKLKNAKQPCTRTFSLQSRIQQAKPQRRISELARSNESSMTKLTSHDASCSISKSMITDRK